MGSPWAVHGIYVSYPCGAAHGHPIPWASHEHPMGMPWVSHGQPELGMPLAVHGHRMGSP